jgi:hypothetical protein
VRSPNSLDPLQKAALFKYGGDPARTRAVALHLTNVKRTKIQNNNVDSI